jgi:hydrogenase nickel incorporation protein HypA/HybF
MHEMALCESVLQIVEATARRHGAARVKTVRLEIGELSHVEPEAMRFSFQVVTRQSIAADATLEIDHVPGSAWCMQCSAVVAIARRGEGCPTCGSYQLQVTGGEELRVKDIEID